jgi:DNA-binding NarL/FixJ family response regulator
MRKLADDGMAESDIAWRFRRSPAHVRRVLDMTRLRRKPSHPVDESAPDLRPIERVVLRARQKGTDTAEIAARLRRTPRGVAQIEKLATYKLERRNAGEINLSR